MQNVSEFLQTTQKGLYQKCCENDQMAKFFMAFLSNLVLICHKKGTPIEGIAFEAPFKQGEEVRGKINFHSLAIASAQIWGGNDFKRYVSQHSNSLWKALDKNPAIGRFVEQVANVLEKHGERNGLVWKDVSFKKAVIAREDVLIITLGKDTLDKWGR